MSIVRLVSRPLSEQISALERGLPIHAVTEVASQLNISRRELAAALDLRHRPTGRCTLAESERLLRVMRIRKLLRGVFPTDALVSMWFQAQCAVHRRTPLSLLRTDVGEVIVMDLVRTIRGGRAR